MPDSDDASAWTGTYASRIGRISSSEIRERMKMVGERAVIQLGVGLPDPSVVPYALLSDASAAIFADPARVVTSMRYGPTEGYGPLREWLVDYMHTLGVPCSTRNVMVVSGSQQAFDLLGKVFVAPSDTVLVEAPSFIGALGAFDMYEPRYVSLADDSSTWDSLPTSTIKLCYTSPDFRNPTGTCMSMRDREALLSLAHTSRMVVVEDACYEKLRYDGEAIPSMLALDVAERGDIEQSRVCYTNTFSKTISPSLRVGWVVGPSAIIEKLTLAKQASDLASSMLSQMLALDVAATHLTGSLELLRTTYAERRDAMLAALRDEMPPGVTWTEPEGGLYVWLRLPPTVDGDDLALRALRDFGVSIISGRPFFPIDPDRNTARLSFSLAGPDQIRSAVSLLADLVRAISGEPTP